MLPVLAELPRNVETMNDQLPQQRQMFRIWPVVLILLFLIASGLGGVLWTIFHQPSKNVPDNIQQPSGALAEKLDKNRKDTELSRKLPSLDPNEVQAQRDLSNTFIEIGDVLFHSGKVDEAKVRYQKGLEIHQKLAADDPNDAKSLLDLAISLQKLGSVEQALLRYEQAIEMYDHGLKLLQMLKWQNRLPQVNEQLIVSLEKSIAECRKLKKVHK